MNPEQEAENNELEKLEKSEANNDDLIKKFNFRNFFYPISMQTEQKRERYISSQADS